jgi:hypothetical protein
LAALSGVNGARVSPGCVSLGTEIFISQKKERGNYHNLFAPRNLLNNVIFRRLFAAGVQYRNKNRDVDLVRVLPVVPAKNALALDAG